MGGSGLGGQVGCERRIEVFGIFFGGGVGRGVRWGVGLVRGVRVDVNAMLGVGGDVGYGGCEPRKEGIVQYTKKVLYNIKKIKKMWGEGGNI